MIFQIHYFSLTVHNPKKPQNPFSKNTFWSIGNQSFVVMHLLCPLWNTSSLSLCHFKKLIQFGAHGGSNSYEVCKAIIQARMLSGRYRTDQFLRHFTENDGSCTLCNTNDFGSIEHLLILCPALTDTRNGLLKKLNESPTLTQTTKTIIVQSFHSVDSSTQMMLDPSTTPEVISATQLEGPSILEEVFRFSRSWCYSLHKTQLKLLGRWKK